jgi:hypothetical protein
METAMMIKDPEQLLLAAEVLKLAKEMHTASLHTAHAASQHQEFDSVSDQYVEAAYRKLVAIGWKMTAIQGKDDGEAATRAIDATVPKMPGAPS